jgi:hypothetical protein
MRYRTYLAYRTVATGTMDRLPPTYTHLHGRTTIAGGTDEEAPAINLGRV